MRCWGKFNGWSIESTVSWYVPTPEPENAGNIKCKENIMYQKCWITHNSPVYVLVIVFYMRRYTVTVALTLLGALRIQSVSCINTDTRIVPVFSAGWKRSYSNTIHTLMITSRLTKQHNLHNNTAQGFSCWRYGELKAAANRRWHSSLTPYNNFHDKYRVDVSGDMRCFPIVSNHRIVIRIWNRDKLRAFDLDHNHAQSLNCNWVNEKLNVMKRIMYHNIFEIFSESCLKSNQITQMTTDYHTSVSMHARHNTNGFLFSSFHWYHTLSRLGPKALQLLHLYCCLQADLAIINLLGVNLATASCTPCTWQESVCPKS